MRWGCSGKWPSLNHREDSQKLSLRVFAFRIVKINFWLFKQTSAQYFVMAAIGNKYGNGRKFMGCLQRVMSLPGYLGSQRIKLSEI